MEKNKGIDTSFYYYKNFQRQNSEGEDTWGELEINLNEVRKIVLTYKADPIPLISKTDSGQKPETKPEIEGKKENQQSSANSKENSEPDFLWRKVPTAEKCELCGQLAVEFEINDIQERQILRRCESCFHAIRLKFGKAVWRQN